MPPENLYQLEVKYNLVKYLFPPDDGWDVLIDIDAMERAKGPQQKSEKKTKVMVAETGLMEMGVRFGTHHLYGRVDVYAEHFEKGIFLIEVEGKSAKQKEQALYSSIGQTVLMMKDVKKTTYGLAVPDHPDWEYQIQKIPERVKKLLNLKCYLVSQSGVRAV